MTKGLADADGPQFHLLFFFRHRRYLISHHSSSQDLLLSMNTYLQSHIVIPNNHVDVDVDIDIDIDVVCC